MTDRGARLRFFLERGCLLQSYHGHILRPLKQDRSIILLIYIYIASWVVSCQSKYRHTRKASEEIGNEILTDRLSMDVSFDRLIGISLDVFVKNYFRSVDMQHVNCGCREFRC